MTRTNADGANILLSGALGATSYDQLPAGTRVNDDFGKFYGTVIGPYVSPSRSMRRVDAASLAVVVDTTGGADRGEQVISGRWLEPILNDAEPLTTEELDVVLTAVAAKAVEYRAGGLVSDATLLLNAYSKLLRQWVDPMGARS